MAAGAGLHAARRGAVALAREPDPALDCARLRLHRADRADHPRDHARGAEPGLHQDGAGERPRPAGDPVPARAEERRRADRDRHRHRHRARHRRGGGDGERVRHPGARAADDRRDPAPRLPGHPGRRAALQLRLRARQSRRRSRLHADRSEDPLLNAPVLATPAPEGIAVAPDLPDILPAPKARGRIWGFVRRHPAIAVGGALVALMLLMALLAPYLWTVDPTTLATHRRTREPSVAYWFGTDMLGRDIYSRVLYGARVSLIVGFSVAVLASFVGLVIGIVSGFPALGRLGRHTGDGRV